MFQTDARNATVTANPVNRIGVEYCRMSIHLSARRFGSACHKTFVPTARTTSAGRNPSAASAPTPTSKQITPARIGGNSGRHGQREDFSVGEGFGIELVPPKICPAATPHKNSAPQDVHMTIEVA